MYCIKYMLNENTKKPKETDSGKRATCHMTQATGRFNDNIKKVLGTN